MAEHDILNDAIERLEFDERKDADDPFMKIKQITRRTALTGGAAGIAALALGACGSSSSSVSTSKALSGSANATWSRSSRR